MKTEFSISRLRCKAGPLLLAVLLPLLAASVVALAARPVLAAAVVAMPSAAVEQTTASLIEVTMTVGTTANQCATTNSITIKAGTPVFTCYTFRNTSPISSTDSVIFDSQTVAETDADGVSNVRAAVFAETIEPQESAFVIMNTTEAYIPQASVVRKGTLAARSGTDNTLHQAMDNVTITVANPAVTVMQTLSRSPSECSGDTTITAPSGAAVYRCITLTNTGDAALEKHALTITNTPPGSSTTYSLTVSLPKAGTLQLTNATAPDAAKAAFVFNPTADTDSLVSVVSSTGTTPDFAAAAATSSATVHVVAVSTTVAAALNNNERCGPSSDTSLMVSIGESVYYCLRLTNTGGTTLTHHVIAMSGQAPVTMDADLAPNVTLEIASAMFAEKGLPPILGPVVASTNLNTTFVVTSTAAGGFQSVANAPQVSVLASTPTPTPTPTWTLFPTVTPWPTWTPWPMTPTWTPWPTWTPTPTLVPPSPTWTRSFELSNLQTPTPGAAAGAAAPLLDANLQATAVAQYDSNAALPPDPLAAAPFDSALATPFINPNESERIGAALLISDTATPTLPPTIEPTRTPLPTQTPSPTVTPTATQRPVVYAAPAPPASFAGTFANVLDSTLAAAGILFFTTGAVVFFGVLALVLGIGFLRASRHRYELLDTEGENPDFIAASPQAGAGGAPPRTPTPGGPGDRWPTSLP